MNYFIFAALPTKYELECFIGEDGKLPCPARVFTVPLNVTAVLHFNASLSRVSPNVTVSVTLIITCCRLV